MKRARGSLIFPSLPLGVLSEPTYRLIPLMPRLTALSLSAVPILDAHLDPGDMSPALQRLTKLCAQRVKQAAKG